MLKLLESNFACIGGSGSSGSSLLAQLLDETSAVVCGNEMSIFSKPLFYDDFSLISKRISLIRKTGLSSSPYALERTVLRNIEQYGLDKNKVYTKLRESKTFQEFVKWMADEILSIQKKTLWVEKTPDNIYMVGSFLHGFPKAKFIHIVRDPRDVVLSLMKRGHSCESSAAIWLSSVACVYTYRNHDRLLEIRYEDLVLDTDSTMQKVFDFLQIGVWKGRERKPSLDPQKRIVHNVWTNLPSEPIRSTSLKKYAKFPELNRILSWRLSDELSETLGISPFSIKDLAQLYGYDTDCNVAEPKSGLKCKKNSARSFPNGKWNFIQHLVLKRLLKERSMLPLIITS